MTPANRLLFAHAARALALYVPEAEREARRNGGEVPSELLALAQFLRNCASARQDATELAAGCGCGDGRDMTNDSLLLEKREAAAVLSISVRQLERLIAENEIPSVHVGMRAVRIRRSDLKAYVDSLSPRSFRDDLTAKDIA